MLPMEYEAVRMFGDGYIVSRKEEKPLRILRDAQTEIPLDVDEVGEGGGQLARVRKGEAYGFMDFMGRVVIPLEYEGATVFTGGYAAVKKEGKWGFIDRSGGVCVPFVFDYASPFSEGIAVVSTAGQFPLLFDSYEGE